MYDELNLTVGEALQKRLDVNPIPFTPPFFENPDANYLIVGLSGNIHLFCR